MSTPTIVLVDDDIDKRFLLKRLFNRNFPESEVADFGSCADATPFLSFPGPKIVVTNGRIAGGDGLEFASYASNFKHLPVVMISLRSELKQKALEAGVLAFVETGEDDSVCRCVELALRQVHAAQN